MYKILIVDDNKVLLDSLKIYFESEGFNVDIADKAVDGIVKVKSENWDLVLLDYYLDDMEAEVFMDIVVNFENLPKIAVFTAKAEEEMELNMLQKNVADFIRKSENPQILVNRVRRIIEGDSPKLSKIVSHQQHIEMDLESRSVTKDGEDVILTKTEFEILLLFLRNKNRVLTREKIYDNVWQKKNKYLEELRTIDVHVLKLRRKLELYNIVSRKGVGYVWKED